MGDPRRLKRKYETPRAVLDAERIREESALVAEYGLKNTRELWVTLLELKKMRRGARRALSLGNKGEELGRQIMAKLTHLGIMKEGMKLEDVLALTVRDFLERRLQTRVQRKGLARTMAQSRQLITHGFISIKGKRVSSPSYLVPLSEEDEISYYKPIALSEKAKM